MIKKLRQIISPRNKKVVSKDKATVNEQVSVTPRVWVSEIVFNDNTTLQLSKNDIVIFVGPNNAGKSASLNEIAQLVAKKNLSGLVVKEVSLVSEGSEREVSSFIQENSIVDPSYGTYNGFGF